MPIMKIVARSVVKEAWQHTEDLKDAPIWVINYIENHPTGKVNEGDFLVNYEKHGIWIAVKDTAQKIFYIVEPEDIV